MAQWVRLIELGDRRCDAVKFNWNDIQGKINGGINYCFSRVWGECVPTDNEGSFRFDFSACNVVDYNLNGGGDINYGFYLQDTQDIEVYNEGVTYQGTFNDKDYYVTVSEDKEVMWEWTEPLYYYGDFYRGFGTYDDEPVAADGIYVRLYEGGNVEPDEPVTPDEPTNPTIMDNVNRIEQAKLDIKDAIRSKGIYVDDLDRIDTYASKIYEISQEGGNLGELYASVDKYSGTGYWDAMYDETYDGYRIVSINAEEYGQNNYRVGVEDTWGGITNFADGATQENPWITPQVINYVLRYMSDTPNAGSTKDYYFVKGTVMSIERIASSTANFTIGYTLGGNSTYNVTVQGCKYIDGATPFPEDGIKVGDNVVVKARIKTSNYEPILGGGTLISVETPEEGGGYDNPLSYGLKFAYSDITEVPEWANLPQSVTNIINMFNECSKLTDITKLAEWDVSNVVGMISIFKGCSKLTDTTPLNNWDVSKCRAGQYVFQNTSITEAPSWDISEWTELNNFLVGTFNTLERMPKYNVGKATYGSNIFGFESGQFTKLTDVGGLEDLKMSIDNNYGFYRCPNLSYQSLLNIISGLYDYSGTGEERKLKFHPNAYNLLTEDDIAIATNKGWSLI